MCVDIIGIIVTLLYFTTGMVFNQWLIDFENGEKFSIWLMLFWPLVVISHILVLIFVCIPWRIKRWFVKKFKKM